MIKKLTSLIPHPKRDCIYDIVGQLRPALCIDIGAAAGHVTRTISLASGPATRIVAFEPFPGNHDHFSNTVSDLVNDISLVKKAVSDEVGWASFFVPSTVHGTEKGWENLKGYSSVGFLYGFKYHSLLEYLVVKLKALIKRFKGRPAGKVLRIETTTIDTEFPQESIDFIKIDVQGAEAQVLKGAKSALENGRVGVLYVEWAGEEEVIDILSSHGYEIYDSNYIVCSNAENVAPYKDMGFEVDGELNLSTGKKAYEMVLTETGDDPVESIRKIKQRKLGWVQTDLIAIHPNFKQRFMSALDNYLKGPQ